MNTDYHATERARMMGPRTSTAGDKTTPIRTNAKQHNQSVYATEEIPRNKNNINNAWAHNRKARRRGSTNKTSTYPLKHTCTIDAMTRTLTKHVESQRSWQEQDERMSMGGGSKPAEKKLEQRKHTHTHTHTHTHARTHERTHARANARTHARTAILTNPPKSRTKQQLRNSKRT